MSDHRHLFGTCANKTYFHRLKSAERVARQVRKSGGTQLRPYRCQYCGGWHLTSIRPALKSKDNSKGE